MKENNSPLYRRRQARGLSIEDAAYINRAGRDIVSETIGREIGGLGAVLGEALGKAKKKKQAKKAQEEQAKKAQEQQQQQITQDAEEFSEEQDYLEMQDDIAEYEIPDTGLSLESTGSTDVNNYYTFTDQMAWDGLSQPERDLLKKEQNIVDFDSFTRAASNWRTKNDPEGKNVNLTADKIVRDKSVSTPWGGLKAPINRLSPLQRRGSRGGFSNELAGLYSVGQPGPVKGSDDTSQYTEGRTYIAKDRMLSAPSWMGSAAIEGYNMVTEAVNYERQVQADTQDYFNEQLKGLDPGRTGYNIIDDSITEMVMDQQKKYLQHQKERQQWENEGRGSEWYTKNKEYMSLADNVLNARDIAKTKVDEYVTGLKNGEIDIEASDPIGLDLLNTVSRGGGLIGVADLGEGPSLVGATSREEPVNMNLTTIGQQLNKINLVAKQEPMEFYNTFTANLKNGKIPGVEKEVVEGPDGMKTTKYNLDQIGKVADLYIKEELKDVMDAKGYGSALLGMDHGQWTAMANAGKDPREVIAAQMKANLVDLLRPMTGFESREGTARATSIMKERIAKDKEGRSVETKKSTKQKKEDNLNSLIDFIMQEGEKSYSPDKIVEGETAIPELTMKTTGADYPGASVIEGAKGVKTTSFNPNTGILTIQPSAAITVKDGSTTVKTTEPQTIDFTQDPAIVRQNLYNLLEQLKITGPSNNTEGGQSVTTTTKESNFRKKYNY